MTGGVVELGNEEMREGGPATRKADGESPEREGASGLSWSP